MSSRPRSLAGARIALQRAYEALYALLLDEPKGVGKGGMTAEAEVALAAALAAAARADGVASPSGAVASSPLRSLTSSSSSHSSRAAAVPPVASNGSCQPRSCQPAGTDGLRVAQTVGESQSSAGWRGSVDDKHWAAASHLRAKRGVR